MSFYGDKQYGFTIDKIYSSRQEMNNKLPNDGVFLGRYVLISYGEDRPISVYAREESNGKFSLFSSLNFNESSRLTLKEGFLYQDVITKRFFKKDAVLSGLGSLIGSGADGFTYLRNYIDDNSQFGQNYDSTIWQKTDSGYKLIADNKITKELIPNREGIGITINNNMENNDIVVIQKDDTNITTTTLSLNSEHFEVTDDNEINIRDQDKYLTEYDCVNSSVELFTKGHEELIVTTKALYEALEKKSDETISSIKIPTKEYVDYNIGLESNKCIKKESLERFSLSDQIKIPTLAYLSNNFERKYARNEKGLSATIELIYENIDSIKNNYLKSPYIQTGISLNLGNLTIIDGPSRRYQWTTNIVKNEKTISMKESNGNLTIVVIPTDSNFANFGIKCDEITIDEDDNNVTQLSLSLYFQFDNENSLPETINFDYIIFY